MKSNIKNITFLLLCLFLVLGCKKNANTTSGTFLLSQAVFAMGVNTQINSYQYDDRNRLIELTINGSLRNNGAGYSSDCKLTYDSNDRVIEADFVYNGVGNSEKNSFNYSTAGMITKTTVSQSNGVITNSTSVITLNSNQQALRVDFSGSVTGTTTVFPTATLNTYDANGNLKTQTTYVNGAVTPSTATVETYDQNKSPFFNMKGNFSTIFPDATSINNVITKTSQDVAHNSTETDQSSWEYNGDGFPTKLTTVIAYSTSSSVINVTGAFSYLIK
jgi:hypothetical protein